MGYEVYSDGEGLVYSYEAGNEGLTAAKQFYSLAA
jgi:hypothetical protein